jgi:hypothetical protein
VCYVVLYKYNIHEMEGNVARKEEKKEPEILGRKRLNMWLAQRHHDELQGLASYDGRSVSDLIRQASF